eukprot:scaffold126703_cov45-Phaeocystis_antarctica.AAC.1
MSQSQATIEAQLQAPEPKHVPSMPQRQSTIDARLQASVKSGAPLTEGRGFLKRASTLFGLLGE